MSFTIQLRRDTAAHWTSKNPILASGELGIETDTRSAKLGDGVTAWASLAYWDPALSGAEAYTDVETARAEAAESTLNDSIVGALSAISTETTRAEAAESAITASIPTLNYMGIFGDGSDGSVTLDGTVTVPWANKVGSVYTTNRDARLTSLTVNSGVTLQTVAYRVFCQGTVTNNGTIQNVGNPASGSSGGSLIASGVIGGSTVGPSGGTGAGSNPSQQGSCVLVGQGGNGGAGASGAGGTGAAQRTANPSYFACPYPLLAGCVAVFSAIYAIAGGQLGASGGGDGTNHGGGGGVGGGVVAILAPSVVNNGVISVVGGDGGTPAAGNCGGGGGGGGGLIWIITLTPWTAGTTFKGGGNAGSGVGTGAAGTNGTAGTVINIVLQ